MRPYYEDLEVPQGTDYRFQIQMYTGEGSRRDLSNVSEVRGEINYSYQANDSDAVNFFCTVDAPPTKGVINCTLSAEQTEGLDRRRYLYDIEMVYNSKGYSVTERVLEGKVIVDKAVTR
jgi:hypothetical protein